MPSEEELFNKDVDEMKPKEMKEFIAILRSIRVAPRVQKKKVTASKKEKDLAAFKKLIGEG